MHEGLCCVLPSAHAADEHHSVNTGDCVQAQNDAEESPSEEYRCAQVREWAQYSLVSREWRAAFQSQPLCVVFDEARALPMLLHCLGCMYAQCAAALTLAKLQLGMPEVEEIQLISVLCKGHQ